MSSLSLRNKVKKAIDLLPDDKLISAADFLQFLGGRTPELDNVLKITRMQKRIAKAEKEFAEGKGVSWRKVRRDV